MKGLSLEEILEATCGELLCGDETGFTGVSIDSRTISEGELFFALRGERFDGHRFVTEALKKGGGAVVEEEPDVLPEGRVVIKVRDTLRALQDLAHFYRKRLRARVVAITGSNGKTTTKEMAYTILSKRFVCERNEGNLNNHIGLPLSILRLSPEVEVVVLEMGMNAKGEIRRLCEIGMPEYGVVTNIGPAHIGMLGSIEAIRDAKLEIMEGLRGLIVNADDDLLMDGVRGFKGMMVTFSIKNEGDVMAGDIVRTDRGSRFRLRWRGEGVDVDLPLHGVFNIYNALAASAVGLCLGMKMAEVREGLQSYHAFPMRFDVITEGSLTIINDSYNANPVSMREALNGLVEMKGDRRAVAILGDMHELGDLAEDAHRDIGRMIGDIGIDEFIAIGEMMAHAAQEASTNSGVRVHSFRDVDEAGAHLRHIIRPDDIILLKGSRIMGMERLLGVIRDAV
jgi:UDP-N-acetylmuramoyl-tripeptide--D-alanyl-D-alanine ligase